jgi:predicted nucleotidyltransferase
MKENIQEELTTIIQAIASKTNIESIFLFGSWAYGEPKPDNDIV